MLEEGARWNWFDDRDDHRLRLDRRHFRHPVRRAQPDLCANPVVDLRALRNRNFALGCFLSFVTGIGIFSTIYLTPLFLGYVRGFSAWQTGIAIFSTGAASLVGVPVYVTLGAQDRHALADDVRARELCGSRCGRSASSPMIGAATSCSIPQILRGFPQVFAVAPAVTLGLGSLPPERLKYASGLFNMMRNLGGAVGIAVCGAILNNRTNLHFLDIASHLTPANGAMEQLLHRHDRALERRARRTAPAGHAAALSQLWQLAYREASTLAYADAFRAIMVAFVVATLLVPLLRKVAPGARPAPAARSPSKRGVHPCAFSSSAPARSAAISAAGCSRPAATSRFSCARGAPPNWRQRARHQKRARRLPPAGAADRAGRGPATRRSTWCC